MRIRITPLLACPWCAAALAPAFPARQHGDPACPDAWVCPKCGFARSADQFYRARLEIILAGLSSTLGKETP